MNKEILYGLGLTKNEVEVYLTLLKSGAITVNDIGAKSGLHRQVCYDALERLLEKGFVSYFLKENKKYFQALEPHKILDYLQEKIESVKEVLPELVGFTRLPREETIVEVIKGKNVVRIILKDVIKTLQETKDELRMLGVEETKFVEEDRIAIQQYLRDLKRFKLKEKLLAKEGARLYFEGEQSKYRLVKPEFFNPNPLYIYGGKVAQIIWGSPNHGIITKNKEVYDSNKKYFELLWKIAKPLKR